MPGPLFLMSYGRSFNHFCPGTRPNPASVAVPPGRPRLFDRDHLRPPERNRLVDVTQEMGWGPV